MNKEILTSRGALAGLAVLLVLTAGCAGKVTAPVRDAGSMPQAAPTAERKGVHVVQTGDTLNALARQYGVSVADLVAWNGLSNPNQIHVGQSLRVAPEGGGEVAQAIPIVSEPAVTVPIPPMSTEVPTATATAGVPIKQTPLGGKQPYSDEAWARLQKPAEGVVETKPATPSVADAPRLPGPDGEWLWPVKGKVLLGFDEPVGGDAKLRNKGIDIAGTPGTPVLASAGGKVVYAGSGLRGLGKLVIIKHDDNYLTAYAHNQQLLVKEADAVTKGQQIAELGSTDADRPKLHFEIRKQGQPVDPMKYLPAR
ncbi:peptidoglycan DD-metalloendopeptidase family protein [Azoarcus communis]|uniref:Peptidase n=1 Tax=Parazoarcus communis SWub3 = DSM 12120 TaxID=1121029 RepID=A0A323UU86_9RHOO|nr:peptidoglycan DD-metalloendopeptidase family protein [Parazoarcus communis]NMG46889.1 peptidoglycan DD-metalloendopeptidase family protein [Parazoarcus communis]NMG69995.1 peptidoglycan DD-metalloendopeptidase family protein [Parazoarcus communis SWub3 = DSM 12120]PZA16572.1 peptidase [Azoarcus communis] [Parazoarcus communis SWub3 = DSM 12120]